MEPKIRKSWNSKPIPESCSWPSQGLERQNESCRGISGSAPDFERNGLLKHYVKSIKEKTSRNYTQERFNVIKIRDSAGRKASAQKSCRNIMGRSCSSRLKAPKAKKEYGRDYITAESNPKEKNECRECVQPEEPSLIDKTDHFQAFDRLIKQSVQQEYFEEHKFRAILRDAFKNE